MTIQIAAYPSDETEQEKWRVDAKVKVLQLFHKFGLCTAEPLPSQHDWERLVIRLALYHGELTFEPTPEPNPLTDHSNNDKEAAILARLDIMNRHVYLDTKSKIDPERGSDIISWVAERKTPRTYKEAALMTREELRKRQINGSFKGVIPTVGTLVSQFSSYVAAARRGGGAKGDDLTCVTAVGLKRYDTLFDRMKRVQHLESVCERF